MERDDDTSSVGSGSTANGPSIELGFVERVDHTDDILLNSRKWTDWDGGKAGGKPVWLNPASLPPHAEFSCSQCERPMALVTQLYAPLDDADVGHSDAFHRMLYVFTCVRGECVNRPSPISGSDSKNFKQRPSVLVYRCQLSKANRFHAGEDVLVDDAVAAAPTCLLCGAPAPHRCSRCKGPRYCSKVHQMIHWRTAHKAACNPAAGQVIEAPDAESLVACGCVLPEYDIVIEREPSVQERRQREAASLPEASAQALKDAQAAPAVAQGKLSGAAAAVGESSNSDDGEEVDESQLSIDDLTQRALAETTGARLFADDVMRYFQRRVSAEPSQVIRYCRWPDPALNAPVNAVTAANDNSRLSDKPLSDTSAAVESPDTPAPEEEELEIDADGEPFGAPLWLTSANQPANPATAIPPCEYCGAERRFEFQVMPQLLNFVNPDAGSRAKTTTILGNADAGIDLDFGTIAVYTCTKSCSGSSTSEAYKREFAWVQPMREEDDAAAGAEASGSGENGGKSILHEALRRVQAKQQLQQKQQGAIKEEDEETDGDEA